MSPFVITWKTSYSAGKAFVMAVSAEEAKDIMVKEYAFKPDQIEEVEDMVGGVEIVTTWQAED